MISNAAGDRGLRAGNRTRGFGQCPHHVHHVIIIKCIPKQIFKSAIHPFHIIFYFHASWATVKPEVPLTLRILFTSGLLLK